MYSNLRLLTECCGNIQYRMIIFIPSCSISFASAVSDFSFVNLHKFKTHIWIFDFGLFNSNTILNIWFLSFQFKLKFKYFILVLSIQTQFWIFDFYFLNSNSNLNIWFWSFQLKFKFQYLIFVSSIQTQIWTFDFYFIFNLICICRVVCLSVCMNPVNGQAVGPILTKFGMGA